MQEDVTRPDLLRLHSFLDGVECFCLGSQHYANFPHFRFRHHSKFFFFPSCCAELDIVFSSIELCWYSAHANPTCSNWNRVLRYICVFDPQTKHLAVPRHAAQCVHRFYLYRVLEL